jgi:rhodanese-related sulfurtransferase
MAHVPGALPLPEDDFEKAFTRIEPRLRSTFDLVVYCSGFGCEASHIVAKKLKERGIQAAILHEGWPAWEEARYPVREGAEP